MSGIAITGLAGRFPGAPTPDALWDLLRAGREGLTRLDSAALAAEGVPRAAREDARYVPVAAALDSVEMFDAGFFGIGRREAELMDPQQRILLETAWHALEDAGIDPRRPPGAIGVFVGAAVSTYLLFRLWDRIAGPSAPSQLLAMMGNDKDYAATQLAYRLDLRGPAVAVQTACSSSLVAVHMACQSLLSGECDAAIAGGVSIRVPHRVGYLAEAGGMLSPDGHCRSFAEGAAGTVFGSGCGVVVLRRLEDAAARDRVRAVILGSAVNNDGSRKVGFSAPSLDQQSAAITEAMAVAGVAPEEIGHVEGHGTGTPLGDPIEVAALTAAFRGVPPGHCALGSVKSNIGHLETAAGVAGLIKTVLMLERRSILPTLHAERPSSAIPWAETPFALAQAVRPWDSRRRAGVSSFGVGGTNAHLVMAAAPEPVAPALCQRRPQLLLSAADPAALAALAAACRQSLERQPAAFSALAAAATRRARFAWWIEADAPGDLATATPREGPMPEPPETTPGPPTELPPYSFQRQRYWVEIPRPLLGPAIRTPLGVTLHQATLDLAAQPWLADHLVEGQVLLPAALHLALLAEAGMRVVADFALRAPCILIGETSLHLLRETGGTLRVMADRGVTWECLAEGREETAAPLPAPPSPVTGTETLDGEAWAARLARAGLAFGPAFRLIDRIERGAGVAQGHFRADGAANAVTLLDAGLQTLGAAVADPAMGFRPVAVERFAVFGDIGQARAAIARLDRDGPDTKAGEVLWLDAAGAVLAQAAGVVCRRAAGAGIEDALYRLAWRREEEPALTAPYAELERIARGYAQAALAQAGPAPARADLARQLRPHAALAEPDPLPVAELVTRHPPHAAEIALVARCGEALPEVLAGRRDPLELLFGNGPEGAYRGSPLGWRLNRIAAAVAASCARPRRVLEIGGGTGATTEALRGVLRADAEYLFTDLSPAFLDAAATRFAGWSGFRTAVLDIARDPAAQGIETGVWDLVVAANVLHATPDLAETLRHARRLLAPAGRLLLIEGTGPLARLDITFGLTAGWSNRRDLALRPDHPLLPAAHWLGLLGEAGLSQPTLVAELGGQAVLTATGRVMADWLAIGRDPALARRLGLAFLPVGAPLPAAPLTGLVALAGLEEGGDRLGDLLTVCRALAGRAEAPRLLLPTLLAEAVAPTDRPDPERAALHGLLRTLAREHPALRPRSVDCDTMAVAPEALARERLLADGEDRVAWRHGERLLARLARLPPAGDDGTPPAALRLDPGSLEAVPMALPEPGPGEVRIRVRAAGINFKDVLTASGGLPGAAGLGGECAGEVEAVGAAVAGLRPGDAVLAVAGGALASHVVADARLVLPKPPSLGFAAAAALPIAGVTAWYALRHLAPLAPGQRVLIHAATGGVGWFAVRLAQAAGAVVVATAGSAAKRQRLRDLGVPEVYSSRDTGFAAAAPVDVVLSALPAERREAGLRLLKPGGHFIEIGRLGVPDDANIAALRPDIAWHVVALDAVEAPVFSALLQELLAAVAREPGLLPPVETVPLARAGKAFERMRRAEHVGKLVALPAPPLSRIRGDGTYVVTGGLGGLGPAIAAWLERRGAGGVLLVARRPPTEARQDVVVGDVAEPATLRAVDVTASRLGLPPVRGVVHAAGVLEDMLIADADPASFARVAWPKLEGARRMLAHWPDLDLFIGFSSAGALLGSAGQAAHTAAGAALDALLAGARAAGRPVLTVDWGAWRDLGAAAARGVETGLAAAGMGSISSEQGFAALDRLLAEDRAQAAVLPIDWSALGKAGADTTALFADLRDAAASVEPATAAPETAPATAPASPAMGLERLRQAVTAECAALLAIRGPVAADQPLHDLGLDSLGSLELRNRLGRLLGVVLPATLLFDHPTIAALVGHLAARLGLLTGPAEPATTAATAALDALTDDDLDAELARFAALHAEAAQ